jgi:hypothetical protein
MTLKELAQALDIGLSTCKRYKALGMPAGEGTEACQGWLEERVALSGRGGSVDVGGHTFSAQEVIDIKARYYLALEQKTKTHAELNELKLKIEKKELVPFTELETALNNVLKPLKQKLDNLAFNIAGKCNPTEPELANKVISEEIQKIFSEVYKLIDENS